MTIDDSLPNTSAGGGSGAPPTPPMYQAIGRYKILRELGRGAMGVVFEAEDPKIGRRVALKVLHDVPGVAAAELEEFKSRFFREARTAGMLSHPNIVVIHDVDSDEKLGISFMAMEYLKGQTVYDLLKSGVKFTTEQAIDICIQVAEGLDHAHRQGIVHRDVKPANLMLLEDGTVKITDFGIAKISTSNLTRTGQFLGTPNYMSPEQVIGHVIDGRSDLFSLGIILYELLTGEKPFMGSSLTTITYQIVNVDPIEPSKIRPGLPKKYDAIAQKLLRKAPDERYQTGKEVAEALRQARDGAASGAAAAAGASAPPPSGDGDATQVTSRSPGAGTRAGAQVSAAQVAGTPPPAPAGANKAVLIIVAGAVVLGLAIIIALAMRKSPEPPVPPAPTVAASATGAMPSAPTTPSSSAPVTTTPASGASAVLPAPPSGPAPASAATASGTSAASAPKPRPTGPTGPRPTVAPIAPPQAAMLPMEPAKSSAAAPAPAPKAETKLHVVLEHKLKAGTFKISVDGKEVLSLDVTSASRKKDTLTADVSVPEGRHDVKACIESAEMQDGPKCATRQFSFVMNREATLRATHGKPMVGPHWFTISIE